MLRVHHTNDLKLVQAEIEAKFQRTIGEAQTRYELEALWTDVGQLQATVIITTKNAIELALAPVKATLCQFVKEVADLADAKISTSQKL